MPLLDEKRLVELCKKLVDCDKPGNQTGSFYETVFLLRNLLNADDHTRSLRAQVELRKFERRERIAVACLQGLLLRASIYTDLEDPEGIKLRESYARYALAHADTLIAEMGEPFP